MKNKALSKSDFKALLGKVKKREVMLGPPLSGKVWVREPTASDRDAFMSLYLAHYNDKAPLELRALYVCRMVVDKDGKRIFSDDDIQWLKELPADAIEDAYNAAKSLTPDSEQSEKDIEDELLGNAPGE